MTISTSPDQLRDAWLGRLSNLIQNVQTWAKEVGWSTRRIDVPLSDSHIGQYKAPALLLQKSNVRIFLEPISRSAPGAEGVVDLYIMPAYDDIATFYYYDGDWHVHYDFSEIQTATTRGDTEAKALTAATLGEVLEAMEANDIEQI